MNQWTYKDY